MTSIPDKIYFDAVLTPNRSLSERGFLIIMCVFGTISFVTGMAFLSMGALPVVGFFGLDVLAVYLAFRWTFRRQREETHILISTDQVRLDHVKSSGETKSAELPTAFTRIELDHPPRPDSWLRVEHGKTAYVIGRFLTIDERLSLAEAMRSAIYSARSERFPNQL